MKKLMLLMTVLACASCAPGLGTSLNLNRFPERTHARSQLSDSTKVQIERFTDARIKDGVGEINGRVIKPEGGVAIAARQEFERALRANGFQLTLFDAPIMVSGEIKTWYVTVEPGFPTSAAAARAELSVELFSPQHQALYRGVYRADATAEHPFLSQDQVEQVLALAMQQAIDQVFEDKDLLKALTSTRGSLRENLR